MTEKRTYNPGGFIAYYVLRKKHKNLLENIEYIAEQLGLEPDDYEDLDMLNDAITLAIMELKQ